MLAAAVADPQCRLYILHFGTHKSGSLQNKSVGFAWLHNVSHSPKTAAASHWSQENFKKP